MANNLLMLDLNNILYSQTATRRHLSFKGKCTGGLYGFIEKMSQLINTYEPDYILGMMDSPPYKRKEYFPAYKGDRTNKDEDLFKKANENRKYILEFLNEIEIPVIKVKGLEADDCFALVVKEQHKYFDKIIICANDDDLFQLFEYDNIILNMGKNVVTKKDFVEKYPTIKPEDWYKIVAIGGGHNNIKGVKGVGTLTAVKKWNGGAYWEEMKKKFPEIDLYKDLIKLPFENVESNFYKLENPSCKPSIIRRYLISTYGIEMNNSIERALSHLHSISNN